MESDKISIIVPVYKVEQYLDRCVNSLVNQTYKNIEIILVDDGSPDNCPQMCDDFARKDSRIRVIHKKNGGLSDARNTGLRMATGEYVMYVDSDDYIENNSCERLIEDINTNIDIVIGACKKIHPTGITYQRHTNLEEHRTYSAKEYVLLSIKRNEWYAPAWLNLYRRTFLIDNELYYKAGYYYEDIEMLPRLFLADPNVMYIDYPFYNYVIREGSIMTSKITEQKINMALDNYKNWFEQFEAVKDEAYRKRLFGVLTKHYIATARRMNITEWKIEGINFGFAMKYSLNYKEKIKTIAFNFFPKLYCIYKK